MLDQNQFAQRREVVVLHAFTDERKRYGGDQVYSITDKGIVIAVNATRILFPWHRVMEFIYHNSDVDARKKIQGF